VEVCVRLRGSVWERESARERGITFLLDRRSALEPPLQALLTGASYPPWSHLAALQGLLVRLEVDEGVGLLGAEGLVPQSHGACGVWGMVGEGFERVF
jgi:hypothetical protein